MTQKQSSRFLSPLLKANQTRADGRTYTAEALRRMAESDPETLRFDGETLWRLDEPNTTRQQLAKLGVET